MFNLGVHWHDMYDDPLHENTYFLNVFDGVKNVGFPKVSLDFCGLVPTACAHMISLSPTKLISSLHSYANVCGFFPPLRFNTENVIFVYLLGV